MRLCIVEYKDEWLVEVTPYQWAIHIALLNVILVFYNVGLGKKNTKYILGQTKIEPRRLRSQMYGNYDNAANCTI